jgi:hypothetical protein
MTIAELAGRLVRARQESRQFSLLLGAGASVNSGAWLNDQVKKDVLERHKEDIQEGEPEPESLDRIWMNRPAFRSAFALDYFDGKTPSPRYRSLSRLTRDGFFPPVLTLNFDMLLEQSLQEIRCAPLVLTRKGLSAEKLRVARYREPVVPKLHVSDELEDFLWLAGETIKFEPDIQPKLLLLLVKDLGLYITGRCGLPLRSKRTSILCYLALAAALAIAGLVLQ